MTANILMIGPPNRKDFLVTVKSTLKGSSAHLEYFNFDGKKLKPMIARFDFFLIIDFQDSIESARVIHKFGNNKKIFFVTKEEQKTQLRRKLQHAVTIGHEWEVCSYDDEDFGSLIFSAINLELHKQKFRTTLHTTHLNTGQRKSEHVPHYRKLLLAERNLKAKKEELEEKTIELQKKVKELEQWERLTVGRELRIVELKKRIKELEQPGSPDKIIQKLRRKT